MFVSPAGTTPPMFQSSSGLLAGCSGAGCPASCSVRAGLTNPCLPSKRRLVTSGANSANSAACLFQGSRRPSCRGGWTLRRCYLFIKVPGGLGLLRREGSEVLQRPVVALPCLPGHAGVRQNEQAASDGLAVGSQIDGGKPNAVALDRGRLVNFLAHRWVQQQTGSGE